MSHGKSNSDEAKSGSRAQGLSSILANLRLLGLCVLAENAGVCAIKTGGGELDPVALWRCGEPVE